MMEPGIPSLTPNSSASGGRGGYTPTIEGNGLSTDLALEDSPEEIMGTWHLLWRFLSGGTGQGPGRTSSS